MPVLAIFEQPNLDEGTYASMLGQLMPLLRSANGFMSHAGGPSPAGGMRIIEIWESEADVNGIGKLTPWRHLKTDPCMCVDLYSSVVPAAGTRPRSRFLSR